MEQFDCIVIGGGPGGYTAALEAAALGKHVLLVEKAQLGGTCLNRGCIPTKALLRAAHTYHSLQNAAEIGVLAGQVGYDFAAMHAYAARTVLQLRSGIAQLLQRAKVTLLEGEAQFSAPDCITVNDAEYQAPNIIIATGSRVAMPPITGADLQGVCTSDTLLTNGGVACKSLVIIGGGVVGVEFAQMYHALGCAVTILEAEPRLLPQLEREVSQNLAMLFKNRGIALHTNAMVSAITQTDGGLHCAYTEKGEAACVCAERVLICTGRLPNTDALGLARISLATERGYIPTDANGYTGVCGIYAIGDVVKGGVQLAHAAEAGAKNAVCAMYNQPNAKTMCVSACVFTQPEIATVGLTADEAKAQGIAVETSKGLTSANGKAIIEGAERGFAKLVYRQDTKVLIGAQLMCPHAGEMIGGLTACVNAALTRAEMESTIFPHPTVSECILGH